MSYMPYIPLMKIAYDGVKQKNKRILFVKEWLVNKKWMEEKWEAEDWFKTNFKTNN